MVRRRKRDEVPEAAKNRKAAAPKNSKRNKGERIEAIAKVAESRERRTNKPTRAEPSSKIANEILRFCKELGYEVVETYRLWLELSLCFEYEWSVSQGIAETAAWRDLKACLDKRDADQWGAS